MDSKIERIHEMIRDITNRYRNIVGIIGNADINEYIQKIAKEELNVLTYFEYIIPTYVADYNDLMRYCKSLLEDKNNDPLITLIGPTSNRAINSVVSRIIALGESAK